MCESRSCRNPLHQNLVKEQKMKMLKMVDQNLVNLEMKNFPGVVRRVYPNLPVSEDSPYFFGEDPIGLFDGENFWFIPFHTSAYKLRVVAEKRAATLSKLRDVTYQIITYVCPLGHSVFVGVHPKYLAEQMSRRGATLIS